MNSMKIISAAATIVVLMVGIVLAVTYKDSISELWSATQQDTQTVFVGSNSFAVTVADSDEERQQGLSGTTELADFTGKLFVFDTDAAHGIWMKDMNYAIDIMWFNGDRELIHIEEGVTPETYTRNRTIFRPSEPARYVLEVNAGTVDLLDITRNQKLVLPPSMLNKQES